MLSGTKVVFAVAGLLLLAVVAQAAPHVAPTTGSAQFLPLVAAIGFAAFRRRQA